MKQINAGGPLGLPVALKNSVAMSKTSKERRSPGLLSGARALLGFALLVSLQLLTSKAGAQTSLPTTSFGCSIADVSTTSCVAGYYAAFGTSSTNYWYYKVNTSGYSGISMSFNTSASSTGPHNCTVYYNTGGSDIAAGITYTLTAGTSCQTKTLTLPSGCDGQSNLTVKLVMSGGTGSSGTNRVNSNGGFTASATTNCSGTPDAPTVSASPSSTVCVGNNTTLSASETSAGTNFTYQWDSAGYTPVGASTNATYIVPGTLSAGAYGYHVTITCPTGPGSLSSTSSTETITENALPNAGAIISTSPSVNIGGSETLTNTTADSYSDPTDYTGAWSASSTAVGTIGTNTGAYGGIDTGNNIVLFTETTNATGCTSQISQYLDVIGVGDLALYIGKNGTSKHVMSVSDETVSVLDSATSSTVANDHFLSNSPCGSGGLSGLSVNTAVATYSASGPHVYFQVLPNTGKQLDITGFSVITRESSTGPTKVRLAYSLDGGTTWYDDGTDHAQSRGASCGTYENTFSFAGGLSTAITSTTYGIIFGIFPYASTSNGGTFQVSVIKINGAVVAAGSCSATPASTGTVTPSPSVICGGSGTATLTLNPAVTGLGVTYQWYDGSGTPVGTGLAFTTPTLVSTSTYSVVATCGVFPPSPVAADTVVIVDTIPNAGVISLTSGSVSPLLVGSTAQLGETMSGGIFSSSSSSIGSVNTSTLGGVTTGTVSGVYGGSTNIIYTVTDAYGCSSSTSAYPVDVAWSGDLALYAGHNGTSTYVIPGRANETAGAFTATGFGTATPCSIGGLGGLTVGTAITTFSTSGPNVGYTLTPASGYEFRINEFHVISRSSGTGPDSAILGYNVNGTGWVMEPAAHHLSTSGSCGAHTNEWYWEPSASFTTAATETFELAIFAYHPSGSTGTFQVQQLETIGNVISTTPCTVAQIPAILTPTLTTGCVSAYYSGSFTAEDSAGITYTWQSDAGTTPYNFTDITDADNIYYASPVYTVSATHFRVLTSCGSVDTASDTATLNIGGSPATISNSTSPSSPLLIGSTTTLGETTTGGTWSTSNTAIAAITGTTSTTATVSGGIPGIAIITYRTAGFGACSVTTTVNVTDANTIAIYWGTGGNSTATNALESNETPTVVSATGFGASTTCGSGGYSGMTESTGIVSWAGANPNIGFSIVPDAGYCLNITGINATVRSSGTGPAYVQLAYSLDGGSTWVPSGTNLPTNFDGCGVSATELSWAVSFSTTNNVLLGAFPLSPSSSAGTFQLNTANATGCITGSIYDNLNFANLDGEKYNYACTPAGSPIQLTCTPSGGVWSSSSSYATVDALGNLQFTDPGTDVDAVITYTLGSCSTSATVTVSHAGYTLCTGFSRHSAPSVSSANNSAIDVVIYPNPVINVLNIQATGVVNVSILSIDGKKLISQDNATSISVGNLASGVYLIKVYDANNTLIKTGKFTKE